MASILLLCAIASSGTIGHPPEARAQSGRPDLMAQTGTLPDRGPVSDPGQAESLVATQSLREHYHQTPWAEQLALELKPGDAPARRTSIRISCDPTSEVQSPNRPAVCLELDTLTIVATPSRLTAINSAAPELAYEAALDPSRPMIDQLRELLPALPFPQLHLALEPDGVDAWSRAMHAVAPGVERAIPIVTSSDDTTGVVELRSSEPVRDTNAPTPQASPPDFIIKYLPDRGAFVEVLVRDTFGTAPGTLRITCKPLDPPATNAFTLDLANRQRVDSLARLRPPEPEIKAGMRLPTLGLVDDTLALWSPQTAFDAQRGPTRTPIRLAMVFYEAADEGAPNQPTQVDQAFDACLLARGLSDKYRRDAVNADRSPQPYDPEPLPRIGVIPVAVFDIGAFSPNAVRQEAIAWSELGTPGAFTSAGPALLKRFNPTGGVSIVVIDEDQIVRGVVAWNGRTSAQRRDDLDAALRGTPVRRTSPDSPASAPSPPATPP